LREGVPDYWVLDLLNRQLMVFRQPVADESAPFGFRYQLKQTMEASGRNAPLAIAGVEISVAEMLPPAKQRRWIAMI